MTDRRSFVKSLLGVLSALVCWAVPGKRVGADVIKEKPAFEPRVTDVNTTRLYKEEGHTWTAVRWQDARPGEVLLAVGFERTCKRIYCLEKWRVGQEGYKGTTKHGIHCLHIDAEMNLLQGEREWKELS